MVNKANESAQRQLAQEQVRKDAQEKASKAWNAVVINAKKNASRINLANTQRCLNKAMEIIPNGKCDHVLEQACTLFFNIEKLLKNQYDAISHPEFKTLETTITSNVQRIQMLDASYSGCVAAIKKPSDNENISLRNQMSQKVMTALSDRKTHLKAVIANFDAKIPPHVDDLTFENARDTLKVESVLLLSELMDDFIPSIQKWKAINEELAAWKSKAFTWNSIFSIGPDELEKMYIKAKEHQLLPKAIEKSADSLQTNMEMMATWMEDYVAYLKRKKFKNDLLYVRQQIESIESIHKLDKRTQFHLMPDADVRRMKMDVGYLNVEIQYSEDEKMRLELRCKQKQILESLEYMRKMDKIFSKNMN